MKHYTASRGWRNHNPLNIRRGANWQGLTSVQMDKDFCQFLNMTWGYRAAAVCMKSYYRLFVQRGLPFTVRNILNRWAPPSENKTEDYIRRVLDMMCRDQLTDYKMYCPYTERGVKELATLIAAMTCVETGCPPSDVPIQNLNNGFILAGLSDPKLTKDWWK